VDVAQDGRSLRVSVSDTGTGIRKEDLGRVFDPYFTTKSSGTGLGLAIVHRIIEAHGGEIHLKSEPGKGTTFTLLLPLDQARLKQH
jgi:two-component system sensor histidine kinase HydH